MIQATRDPALGIQSEFSPMSRTTAKLSNQSAELLPRGSDCDALMERVLEP
jgi:hypothetical protein